MSEKNPIATPDIDFRTDFDENGVLKNPELKRHYAKEREALLGDPVGSVIEQAPAIADPKAEIVDATVRSTDVESVLDKK